MTSRSEPLHSELAIDLAAAAFCCELVGCKELTRRLLRHAIKVEIRWKAARRRKRKGHT